MVSVDRAGDRREDVNMAEKIKPGCTRPAAGVAGGGDKPKETKEEIQPKKEAARMIQVGKPAPDFTAPAYHKGKFISVKLSEYLGKWVVLCFYPGDFTFV